MSIFGRTDHDLHLLRLPIIELRRVEQHTVLNQLFHHCIRLAWREHARMGTPVRDLLPVVVGNAALLFYQACPDEDFDDELLSIIIHDAMVKNDLHVSFGLLLDAEARAWCKAAFIGPLPPRYSVFEHRPGLLSNSPCRTQAALAALLKLHDHWNDYRCNVANDPLAGKTVQILSRMTGKDPQLSDCFVLNRRIAFMQSAVAELARASM